MNRLPHFTVLLGLQLHISRNSFPDGSIPDELYDIGTLESLVISSNGFEGSLSKHISKLSNLMQFWAGSNDITGNCHLACTCSVFCQFGSSPSHQQDPFQRRYRSFLN